MAAVSDRLCISADALSDFEAAGLEIDAILEWAYVDDATARRQRIGLANTLPLLVPMLVFDPNDPWSRDVAAQLDSGVSPLECMTAIFPTKSPESVQVLFGKPLELLGDWSDDILGLMLAIECLEAEELPETDAEWHVFFEFAKALQPCESYLSGHVFKNLCCVSYLSSYEAVRDATDGVPTRLSLINDCSCYLGRWYAEMLRSPVSATSAVVGDCHFLLHESDEFIDIGERLAGARLKQYPVVDLLSQALRWDVALRQMSINAHVHSVDPHLVQWPPLFSEPIVSGGYEVASLSAAADVYFEYRKLGLDIESVLTECALGDSHVVVLRDMAGATQTVARIWLKGPEAGRYLAYDSEHWGNGARYAYQAEVDALDNVLELFWQPEFQQTAVRIVDFHATRRSIVEKKLEELPYRCDVMQAVLRSALPESLLSI